MADLNTTENPEQVIRGSRHRRLLSEAVQLEEEVTPQFVKPILFAILALIVLFIAWSGLAEIKEVAVAPGEIVPSGSVKVVEHLEGGAVEEILILDGDLVEKGQVLVKLGGAQIIADLHQMEARYSALRLRAERLSAFTDGREPDFSFMGDEYPQLVSDQQLIYLNQLETEKTSKSVIQSQIAQRKRELRQMKKSLSVAQQQQRVTDNMVIMRQKMVDKKLIPMMEFLETQRANITAAGEVSRIQDQIKLTNQTVTESQRRLADLSAQLRREALNEMGTVSAEVAEVRNSIERINDQVTRLEITAPIRGLVQELRVQTVGQVIQPGALVMRVVPVDGHLEVEVKIRTNDIGHVRVGQPVTVKVTSYDFSRFGGIDGVLTRISASSHVLPNGEAFFKGWVSLAENYVGDKSRQFMVTPGMGVQAEIATGDKTLLQYLMKPLTDALNRAFHER